MQRDLLKLIRNNPRLRRELWICGGGIIFTLLVFSAFYRAQPEPRDAENELGTIVPAHHLLVPVDFENNRSLSMMIRRAGTVDVFTSGNSQAIITNLRLIKLGNEEGPLFAAIIPETFTSQFDLITKRKKFHASLRPNSDTAVAFHGKSVSQNIIEIQTTEENHD